MNLKKGWFRETKSVWFEEMKSSWVLVSHLTYHLSCSCYPLWASGSSSIKPLLYQDYPDVPAVTLLILWSFLHDGIRQMSTWEDPDGKIPLYQLWLRCCLVKWPLWRNLLIASTCLFFSFFFFPLCVSSNNTCLSIWLFTFYPHQLFRDWLILEVTNIFFSFSWRPLMLNYLRGGKWGEMYDRFWDIPVGVKVGRLFWGKESKNSTINTNNMLSSGDIATY